MREIKYQAFVVVQKLDNLGPNMHLAGVSEYEAMIDVQNISFDKGKIDYITDLEGDEYSFFDKSLIAVREYTGLKDKNGKEIYEGDIVYFTVFNCFDDDEQYKGVVKFAKGQWEIWNNAKSEFYGSDGAFALWWVNQQDDEFEIIGNIHENPELLGDSQ